MWLSVKMHAAIPGSELLVLPGGSHVGPLEQPELCSLRVEKYFTDHFHGRTGLGDPVREPAGARAAPLALLLLAPPAASAQPYDPDYRWHTLDTPHFQVHYHQGLEALAQRAAREAERAHARLAPLLGYSPRQKTQLVLSDDSDSANGSATPLPYNTIRIYTVPAESGSVLNDERDWLEAVITHEYVHILHLDNIGGIPAIVNGIFGKLWPPNGLTPGWMIEGLAVAHEAPGRQRRRPERQRRLRHVPAGPGGGAAGLPDAGGGLQPLPGVAARQRPLPAGRALHGLAGAALRARGHARLPGRPGVQGLALGAVLGDRALVRRRAAAALEPVHRRAHGAATPPSWRRCVGAR